MTQSITHCSQLLSHCERQLFAINQKATHNIAIAESWEDLENVCKEECKKIGEEITTLRQSVANVSDVIKDPFKFFIKTKLDCIENAYKSLCYKIHCESTNQIMETSSKLNDLYKEYQDELKKSVVDLKKIDDLAERSLEIISPALTLSQFERAVTLIQFIETKQGESIFHSLVSMDVLLQDSKKLISETQRAENLKFIKKTLYDTLPSCKMGQRIQYDIFEQIEAHAENPPGEEDWGKRHALDDLDRLSISIKAQLWARYRLPETSIPEKDCKQPVKKVSDRNWVIPNTMPTEIVYEILNPPKEI